MISAVFKGFKKKERGRIGGNAMVYVLVAIALFGVLTATLSSQNSQSDGQDIDDELVEFYATELMEYAAAAKNVVDQMIMTGTTIDQLNFVNPTSSAFNTAPHIHKVYHPQGGGLNYLRSSYPDEFWGYGAQRGWRLMTVTNVEWTPSTANDIIFSFMDVSDAICDKINEKITGSGSNIPYAAGYTANSLFRENAGANLDLDTTACPGCEGYHTLCVADPSGSEQRIFYTILAGR